MFNKQSSAIASFFSVCFCYSSAADDMNWNALEWDRAAEELTWERVTYSHVIQVDTCLGNKQ